MILSFNFDHFLTFFNTITYVLLHVILDCLTIFIGLWESMLFTNSGFVILLGLATERLNPLAPTFFIRMFILVFRSVHWVVSSREVSLDSLFRRERFAVGGTKSQAFNDSLWI
jgi:hypothetical protein